MMLLRRLFAIIAGFGIAGAIWGFTTTGQLFSASRLEQAAASSGTYVAIDHDLPTLLAQVAPLTPTEQAYLMPYLGADLVQGWAQDILPKLETYYRQGGAKPQLDISGIASRVSAAGIPLPAILSTRLSQPLTVSAGRLDRTISETVRWSANARLWGSVIAILAIVLGLLVSSGKRFRFLSGVSFWTALMLVAFWGMLALVPQLIASTVVNSPGGALATPLKMWIETVIDPPRHQLLTAAMVAAGLSVIAFTAQLFVRHGHSRKHAE